MKQKTGRKLLSFLLTLVMVVGLMQGMGLTAYAAEQKVTFTAGGTNNGITVSPTMYMYRFEASFVNNKGQNVSISSSNYNITKLVLTDKKLYSGQWGDSYLGASAGNVSFSGDTMTVTGINAKTVTIQGKNSKYATIGSIDVYYDVPDEYSVTINPGSNMTKTDGSGAASQTGLSGAMTDVVYTADAGYYFPTDYSVAEVNGITVTRDSYTQITVSGTPTADAEITLPAPTQKTTPDAPTTAAATDCTTADNNDGKLTGVTTEMEYKKSDAADWAAGTGSDITGLVPGTYYVRVKATETTNASGNQELTIAGYTAPTHTHAWATAWSNDVTYHWHACTGEGATDACLNETAAAKAAHTYGDTGDARFTCTVCEHVDTTKQAEAEAADLATAKTTAKAELDALLQGKNQADYDADDWAALNQAIADGKAAIDEATTTDAVATAKSNAVDAVNAIKTKAEKAIDNAKTNATATVNGVDANDYIEADRQTVTNAKTTALNAINTATTEAEVTTALTNFNNAIAGCTTQAAADVITQVMNEVSAKTGSDVVYSGNPIQLINTPTTSLPNGYTMKYAVTTENTAPADNLYTTSIPTGTNVGTYYVWYKVVGDANHNDSEPQKVTSTIAKKDEPAPKPQPGPTPGAVALSGSGHVQGTGDVAAKASGKGIVIGTTGESKRLEQFTVSLPKDTDGGIEYRGHLQGIGWGEWVQGGKPCGTTGESRRMEAVQMRLTGALAWTHSVWYRVHSQTWGTLGWARDGQAAGTAGQSKRGEAVEVQVLPKGQVPEGYVEREASYVGAVSANVHLQGTGWTGASSALEFGTTGQARRLEAVRISGTATPVSAGISYEVHAQGFGWMPAKSDGALAGTTGQSRRLEAVRVRLTGEAAKEGNYSVWYRVHSQNYGWLGWTCDGEPAGTTGLSKRAEAIDVQVLPQGQVPRGYDASKAACVNG